MVSVYERTDKGTDKGTDKRTDGTRYDNEGKRRTRYGQDTDKTRRQSKIRTRQDKEEN